MSVEVPVMTNVDFASDQDVRWCPGCGDYSILKQMLKILPAVGVPQEKTVFISGIGCSSRFPYYVNTYGIHGIHGRAPAFATGLKCTRPDLTVWVITGDGDALSIGGNHLLHIIRRNVDVNIVMFNNRIYGLTKGQYSPTSLLTHVSKSTPMGSIDYPLNPLSVAIAAEATFVARSVDFHIQHLGQTLLRAAQHRGTSFVEVYQNCNVFNDNAWEYMTDKKIKDDNMLVLEHGRPMVFGKNRDKGIRMRGPHPEVVSLGSVDDAEAVLTHDERAPDATLAYMLSRMRHPEFPEPVGVFRAISRPTYDDLMTDQVTKAQQTRGRGDLEAMFHSGDTWTVA